MATYVITAPNGEEFEITAPDDATEDQVLSYAKSQFEAMSKSGTKDYSKENTHDGLPARANADGSYSTEVSITVTNPRINNGAPTNIPSMWGGQEVDEETAVDNALKTGKKYPSFKTINEAVAAAKERSDAGGAASDKMTPEMPADPEAAMMQAVETGKTDYTGELKQQLALTGRAAIKGGGTLLGIFGDALNSAFNLVSAGAGSDYRLPMVSDTINKLADAVAVPRNEQERVIGAAAETVASIITSGGAKAGVDWLVSKGVDPNIAVKTIQEMGTKLGQQSTAGSAAALAGQQVTESTDNAGLGLAAGLATAFLTGKSPKMARMTAEQAENNAISLYKQSQNAQVILKPMGVSAINKRVLEGLDEKTLPLKGEGMKSVRETLRLFKQKVAETNELPIENIEKLRKDAANLIKYAGGNQNQRAAGYIIRNAVDDFMSSVSDKMIKSGDKDGIRTLVQGRNAFRTASRAGVLEEVLAAAKYKTEINPNISYDKAVQREMLKLMGNESKLKANFSKEEIDRLKDISKGGRGLQALINTIGVGTGLAGKAAALLGVPATSGASILGYGAAKGAETALRTSAGRARQRGIENEITRILGGTSPPVQSAPIVGSMFGLENIAP